MLNKTEITELLKEMNISELSEYKNIKYHKLYNFIRINNIPYKGREGNGKSKRSIKKKKSTRVFQDYDELFNLYVNQKLSMKKIAMMYNTTTATVMSSLDRFGIKKRLKNGKYQLNKPKQSKEILEKLYFEDNLSLYEIAELLGYTNHGAVQIDFDYYKINRRSYQEAGKLLYEKRPEKKELHRKQFYQGITGPKSDVITSLEQAFIDWADEHQIDITYQFQIRKYWHRYDFRITNTNILVEMDGVFWHSLPEHIERDNKFVETATNYGYNVIRITDEELANNPNIISERILPLLQKKEIQRYANS